MLLGLPIIVVAAVSDSPKCTTFEVSDAYTCTFLKSSGNINCNCTRSYPAFQLETVTLSHRSSFTSYVDAHLVKYKRKFQRKSHPKNKQQKVSKSEDLFSHFPMKCTSIEAHCTKLIKHNLMF